ncbi:hypothetical protein INR49_006511, partial [Caranx melampygus]
MGSVDSQQGALPWSVLGLLSGRPCFERTMESSQPEPTPTEPKSEETNRGEKMSQTS